jgi:hypothetical protein
MSLQNLFYPVTCLLSPKIHLSGYKISYYLHYHVNIVFYIRNHFIPSLISLLQHLAGPWAVTGDFNLILREEDKSNERIDQTNLWRFRRAVASLELQDLHLHGRSFTWSNEWESPTLVRLDRVVVSVDWDKRFPNSHLRALGSNVSDHRPLLLHTNMGHMAKARFTLRFTGPSSATLTRSSQAPGVGHKTSATL